MTEKQPIPDLPPPDWRQIARIAIEDNGEPLVPLSLVPERILVHPAYFLDGIPGAVAQCYARAGVLERLLEASDRLPPGLRLVILDAWRPLEVQEYLYDRLQRVIRQREPEIDDSELVRRTREFVAPPSSDPAAPSPHLTGAAVDLTLCDRSGRMLEMGSEFDEVTARSHTVYYENDDIGAAAHDNRRILYRAMTDAGFSNLPSEWWHFECGDQQWAWYASENVAFYGVAGVEPLTTRWDRQLARRARVLSTGHSP